MGQSLTQNILARVDVIVNTVCPGLVSTDLGRSIAKISKLMQVVVPIHTGLLGKSADYGARFYVTAARTSENEHVSWSLFSSTSGSALPKSVDLMDELLWRVHTYVHMWYSY